MKRVLFVDDEPEEIQGLQKSLGRLSSTWEMAFANGGEQALDWMAKNPVDIVVSDFRMPGMDGAELLNKVAELHPQTLRFIRSSFADKNLILACVYGNHQFIPKPCDPIAMVSKVQRTLALDAWLSDEAIKNLAARMQNLPTMPSSYLALLKQLETPNASLDSVGEAIGKDIALTAKLLQLVNSAFFGLPQRITNPGEAVSILGVDTVKSILLCIQVFTHFDGIAPSMLSLDRLWAHSLGVANLAKKLTMAETDDSNMANDAFTAGLLHDVGKLLLASNLGSLYQDTLTAASQRSLPLWKAEKEFLRASHAELGAYLLGLWGMPIGLLEAVAFHHTPQQAGTDGFTILTAVHTANALVHELKPDQGQGQASDVDLEYLQALGLQDRLEHWRDIAMGKAPVRFSKPAPPAVEPVASNLAPVEFTEEEEASGGMPKWILPAAAIAVLAVAAFVLFRQFTAPAETPPSPDGSEEPAAAVPSEPATSAPARPQETSPAPSSTNEPALTNSSEQPPAPASAAAGGETNFPQVRLSAILYRATDPKARINERMVGVGETVDGVTITAITSTNVTAEFEGRTQVLNLR
jgi:HD-like signal output (HDOD) protein